VKRRGKGKGRKQTADRERRTKVGHGKLEFPLGIYILLHTSFMCTFCSGWVLTVMKKEEVQWWIAVVRIITA